MDERDLSIISQNSGNTAAVLVAAAIGAGHVEPGKFLETFDRVRKHVFNQTLELANINNLPPVQAQPVYAQPQGQPQPFVPPVQVPQPVPNGAPSCPHGVRTFKSGVSSKGAWSAWFCALPKGSPGACQAEFV